MIDRTLKSSETFDRRGLFWPSLISVNPIAGFGFNAAHAALERL